MGAHAALNGITMRTWTSSSGTPGIARTSDITDLLELGCGPYLVETAAIEIENTHNFGGGTIHPIETLREIREICRQGCRQGGVAMHLDGARLWNAHVATGVPMREYGSLFDTVSVCYSKGMGAPVGSVLVSSAQRIAEARVQRKRLGGGMRQAGILAAAALYALDHHIDRLADDHANARLFAEQVTAAVPAAIDLEHLATNIVVMDAGERLAADVIAAAARPSASCGDPSGHRRRPVPRSRPDRRRTTRVLTAGAISGSRWAVTAIVETCRSPISDIPAYSSKPPASGCWSIPETSARPGVA